MGDNGDLKTQNLGQAETANLGQAGNPIKEEIKQDGGNGELKKETETPKNAKQEDGKVPPQTDFKVAEIWIKAGKIYLEAPESFWMDRCRAIGVLEFCKDIIKTAQPPKPLENKIIAAKGNFLSGIRNLKTGRKK